MENNSPSPENQAENGKRLIEMSPEELRAACEAPKRNGNIPPEIERVVEGLRGRSGNLRADCPLCEGSQRETLTLEMDKGIFRCFRCETRGNFPVNGGRATPATAPKPSPAPAPKASAEWIWGHSDPAPDDFPYLVSKGIPSLGLRAYKGSLVVPLSDTDGNLASLQFIRPNGKKTLLSKAKGGRKKGSFYRIDADPERDPGPLHFAEGFATGASIARATGAAVIVAVDAGNLLPVARAIRKAEPDRAFIFCADNDRGKPQGKPGYDEGFRKASEAAKAVGNASFAMPETPGHDFNDLDKAEGPEAVRAALAKAKPIKPAEKKEPLPSPDHLYAFGKNGIEMMKQARDGSLYSAPLCNFEATIREELVRDRDDGETRLVFRVKGRAARADLPDLDVPAHRFAGMGWVSQWGNRAVVYAGNSTKDHLRTAIQLLSTGVKRRVIYEHTGWRKLEDGKRAYITGTGAITAEGLRDDIDVALEGGRGFGDIRLPHPPTGEAERAAVRSSLATLGAAPDEITIPLFAATYLSPFASFLTPDGIWIAGKTESRKSSLAAIFQNHFGTRFDYKHLPASWKSTAKALERMVFCAKDILLTIDDFVPFGSSREIQQMHSNVSMVIRGIGNGAGMARLNRETEFQKEYYPRGLVLATAEDLPSGQSIRARLLILEMTRGTVNNAVLSDLQDRAGRGEFAQAMAGFLRWTAANWDAAMEGIRAVRRQCTAEARKEMEGRAPDMIASLYAAFSLWTEYAASCGAISAEESRELTRRAWAILLSVGRAQGDFKRDADPVDAFFGLLDSALRSGRAYLDLAPNAEDPSQESPFKVRDHLGKNIGWIDGDNLYLNFGAAYATLQEMARAQGQTIPLGSTTLKKRILEKGLVLSRDKDRLDKTVRGMGKVFHLSVEAVVGDPWRPVPNFPTTVPK